MKVTRKRVKNKKAFGARINIVLLDKIDEFVKLQNEKGISTKKIEVVETALRDFLVKEGMLK